MEKYSVLQTVYKSDDPNAFRLSVQSMLSQMAKPDEIVIVKDGPVSEQLQQVIDQADHASPGVIVQVQLEKNVGLGLALNAGLKVCKNELVARMDSDDISLPERCEKQLAAFEDDPELDIVGTQIREFVDDPSNVVGERRVPESHAEIVKFDKRRDPFNHPTVMYRKSKVLKYGPYGDYRKNQDTDLWIKLLSSGCKGANLPEQLLLFRFDENTYQKRRTWLNTRSLISIRWNAYKMRYCSLVDFLFVAAAQLGTFILPVGFQRFVYRKLRGTGNGS